jgi:hypothetical protein
MLTKLVDHALSTPHLIPESIYEALLLFSIASPDVALKFLTGAGEKWQTDIEGRRIYIDLLHSKGHFPQLREFCEKQVASGVDDWKVVKGWIDGYIGCCRADPTQLYPQSRRD